MRPWESVRPAPGERARRARGQGGLEEQEEPRRSPGGSDVDVLIGVPPVQKILAAGSGVRVELCELPGRDTDVVIREDVLPRFWQTIEDGRLGEDRDSAVATRDLRPLAAAVDALLAEVLCDWSK